MSWSFNAVVPAGASETEAAERLEAAMREAQQQAGEWGPETRHQAQVAVNLGAKLAASGALGTGDLVVALSGHANPGHEPTGYEAGDSLTIYCHARGPAGY